MPRNLCSTAVAGSASRRSAPPPDAWATLERSSARRDGALIPSSNRRSSGPTPPVCRRRPRSPVADGVDPPTAVIPTERRLDPECQPDAPPLPAAVPGYPLRCGAFVPLPLPILGPGILGLWHLQPVPGAEVSRPRRGCPAVAASLPLRRHWGGRVACARTPPAHFEERPQITVIFIPRVVHTIAITSAGHNYLGGLF